MLGIMLWSAALAASTPSLQEAAMRSPGPVPGITSETSRKGEGSAAPGPTGQGAGEHGQAAQGPILEPVSAAANPAPARPADSPAAAHGRRTLSTAFVRVGPHGHLTVELRNGRVLVLRDVVMRAKDYCGVHVLGGPHGKQYCGGYADVAAARSGGAPASDAPASAAPNPVKPDA